jgi:polysaccharide export outer membrane protein
MAPTAQATPAESPALVLGPRSVVSWSVAGDRGQPARQLSGNDMVGPDGSLPLGPYGSVQVAGLNVDQARSNIEKHLGKYVERPQVTLQLVQYTTVSPPTIEQPNVNADQPPPVTTQSRTDPVGTSQPTLDRPRPFVVQPAPAVSRGDGNGKPVIASSWRPLVRGAAPSGETEQGSLLPAEWHQLPQGPEKPPAQKPAGDKPSSDKPATDKVPTLPLPPAEQLHSPTPSNGQNFMSPPAAQILPPIVGLPPVLMGPPGHPPVPRELNKVALPPYVIEPPDILLVEYPPSEGMSKDFPISGQHLVRPDGTISLGIYGSAFVGGMTLDQARESIAAQLRTRINEVDTRVLNVDVLAYNSKFYYVITDGGGYGEQVYRLPVTGSETVLDAIGQINGLPPVASKKHIWLARRVPGDHQQKVLPVDWIAIAQHGSTETNYQILPGDRIYVRAQKLIKIDSGLAKFLSPIDRLLGTTLLGSSVVNSISNRRSSTGQ